VCKKDFAPDPTGMLYVRRETMRKERKNWKKRKKQETKETKGIGWERVGATCGRLLPGANGDAPV